MLVARTEGTGPTWHRSHSIQGSTFEELPKGKFPACVVTGLLELIRGLCGVKKKSRSKIKQDKLDFNNMSIFLDFFILMIMIFSCGYLEALA